MNELFKAYKLNEKGMEKAKGIAEKFNHLFLELYADFLENNESREWSIAKTKLEEACFYTKKAMAKMPWNQPE